MCHQRDAEFRQARRPPVLDENLAEGRVGIGRLGEEAVQPPVGPRVEIHSIGFVIFRRDDGIAAAAVEIGAGGRPHPIVTRIALFRDAVIAVDLDAVEVALQDDVDRAGDGVRAVDRSAADGDRLDPPTSRSADC